MTIPSTLRLKAKNAEPIALNIEQNPSLPSTLKPKQKAEIVQFPFEGENDLEREIERNVAQQTSRGIEAVAGLPSDLVNFVGGLFGFEPNLPGSQKLREISEKATGGYTKPQNEFEEKAGDVMQDITSMALPGAGQYSMMRNIGIPIVSNLIKEGINYSGNEKISEGAKIGTMLFLDLLTHRRTIGGGKGLFGGGAKSYSQNLFKQMEESVPKGLSIKTSNLETYLNEAEKELLKGGSRPTTGKALEKIKELKEKIKDGRIDLKDLISFRPAINEWIEDLGGFEWITKPKLREKAIANLNKVKDVVIKSAEEYGEKFNPEFLNLSRSANEAYAVYSKSNVISNAVDKIIGSKLRSVGAKALLGLSPAGLMSPVGMATAGSLGTGYQAFKLLYRVGKSKTLRKYYQNVITGALKGNVGQVKSNAKLLDEELLKEENQ